MEVCPLAKTGKELLLDLVNAENNSTVAEEQLIFGEVQEGGEEGNSAVTLTAAPDAPWNSFVDVKFDRLDLGTLMGGQSIEVSVPKGATKEDIVCHLNYTYGMKFDSREFDLLPQEDGELPELFILKAMPSNLAYTGQFDLKVDLDRMPLAARLTVTDLNGFSYPYRGPSLTHVVYDYNTDYRGQVLSLGGHSVPPAAQQEAGWFSGIATANNGEIEVALYVEAAKWIAGQDASRSFTNFNHLRDPETGEYIVEQPAAIPASPRGGAFPGICFMYADRKKSMPTAKELLDLYDVKLTTISEHHGTDVATRVYTLIADPNRADSFFLTPDAASAAAGAVRRQGSGRSLTSGGMFLAAYCYADSATEPFPNLREISKTVDSTNRTRIRGKGAMIVEMTRKVGEASPIRLEYKFRTTPEVGVKLNESADWANRQYMLGVSGHTTPANNALYLRGGKTAEDGKVMLYVMGRRLIQLGSDGINRADLRNTLSGNDAVTYHTYDQPKQAASPNQALMVVFGVAGVRNGIPLTAQALFEEYDGTWEMRSGKVGSPEVVVSGIMRADPQDPTRIHYVNSQGLVIANRAISTASPSAVPFSIYALVPGATDAFLPGMAEWSLTSSGNTYRRVHGTATVKMTLTPKNGETPVVLDYYIRTNPLS